MDEDCWYGVQDVRKRKQIQDRLAQRARRRRLREAREKANNHEITNPRTEPSFPSRRLTEEGADDLFSRDHTREPRIDGIAKGYSSTTSSTGALSTPTAAHHSSPLVVDSYFLSDPALSICSALCRNGAIIGMLECVTVPATTPTLPSSVPQPLQPTILQLTTLHIPWIDRFPFPRFRDNMITLHALVDQGDFLRDLFCTRSFMLKTGGSSWDPGSWMIGREFNETWGYLFC